MVDTCWWKPRSRYEELLSSEKQEKQWSNEAMLIKKERGGSVEPKTWKKE
jgi:hypothetical protein